MTRSEWTHPMDGKIRAELICIRFPCGQSLEWRWSVDECCLILHRAMHPAVGSGAVPRGRDGEFVVLCGWMATERLVGGEERGCIFVSNERPTFPQLAGSSP